jgi:hypothetical protein
MMSAKNYSNLVIIKKMSNNDDTTTTFCYWLCNHKAELKVYTDFGNILHLCKRCYEIYDPAHRLKTEEIIRS